MNSIDKKLEELILKDWDELFPIEMVPPQDNWGSIFKEEKRSKSVVLTIDTSVLNLASKGSIDMLIGIPPKLLFNEDIVQKMQSIGYEYCIQNNGYSPKYMIFAKGYNREKKNSNILYI